MHWNGTSENDMNDSKVPGTPILRKPPCSCYPHKPHQPKAEPPSRLRSFLEQQGAKARAVTDGGPPRVRDIKSRYSSFYL